MSKSNDLIDNGVNPFITADHPSFAPTKGVNDHERANTSWPEDADSILENIRCNSIILSDYHKKKYFELLSFLKYFRIPIIIISAFASVLNIGLQPFLDQLYISIICCMLSLITGLIGSIELFLQVQKKMENELMNSRDFYLNAIDIYKVLSLEPEHRNGDGLKYLDGKFAMYCKMIENSNIMEKEIQDQLAPIDIAFIDRISGGNQYQGSSSNGSEVPPRKHVMKTQTTYDPTLPSKSSIISGFISYFFGSSSFKSHNHHVKRGFNNPSPNVYREPTVGSIPIHAEESTHEPKEAEVSSQDRFDLYCKLIPIVDKTTLDRITPMLLQEDNTHYELPLNERIHLFYTIQKKWRGLGDSDFLEKLKHILVSDFFHTQDHDLDQRITMEHRFNIYKSVMDQSIDPEVTEQIKHILLKDMKDKKSAVDQELVDLIFTLLMKKPPSSPVLDIEMGAFVPEQNDSANGGPDTRSPLNLVPLNELVISASDVEASSPTSNVFTLGNV